MSVKYRVTYNIFLAFSGKRVGSKAQVVLEVEVNQGESVNDIAYEAASNLFADKRFVVGGEAILGSPVSVEEIKGDV